MARSAWQLYPDFTAYIEEIEQNGISAELLSKIITKHQGNSEYNKQLFKRYMAMPEALPIFSRTPRYEEERKINNQLNNDFFSEIVDFKTGYFAGEPIAYGYNSGEEAEATTGGAEAVDKATKTLTDFIVRNNMFGVDMETTKYASMYGYAGRLLYVDKEGNERVMPVHGSETIILSKTNIAEPQYAVRYYQVTDTNDSTTWHVEFFDNQYIYKYRGEIENLTAEDEPQEHLFEYCPLQGIANNEELLGDAEKVLSLIDDYDKVISDNSNEIESFVHAVMLTSLLGTKEEIEEILSRMNESGSLNIPPVGSAPVNEPAKWLTKNINDAYTEHHLERLEDNIYRFSRTPNLGDESFGNASGISLKFKLHGLETKCAMFEAKMMDASQHMFKVLASAWRKKNIPFDPLQVTLDFKRNFPQDDLSAAQTMQAELAAQVPRKYVYRHITDDPNWLEEMRKAEQEDTLEMYPGLIEAKEAVENGKEEKAGEITNSGAEETAE